MKVIAIANQKGGVGKTASTVNIAAALMRLKHRVLVIDMDAQSNATRWLTGKQFPDGSVIYDVMMRTKNIDQCITENSEGIFLVPANLSLSTLDYDLMSQFNREYRLANALETMSHNIDYVLIDCPPNLAVTTVNAIAAADYVIAPVETKIEAVDAVPRLANSIRLIAKEMNRIIPTFGLPTFLEHNNLSRDMLSQIQEMFEIACLSGIHKTVRLAEAAALSQSIFAYDPTCAGAMDYTRSTEEFLYAIQKQTESTISRSTDSASHN